MAKRFYTPIPITNTKICIAKCTLGGVLLYANFHADTSSKTRGPHFGLKRHLYPNYVCVNSACTF